MQLQRISSTFDSQRRDKYATSASANARHSAEATGLARIKETCAACRRSGNQSPVPCGVS